MSINPTGTAAAPTSSPQLSQVKPLNKEQLVRFQKATKFLKVLPGREYELKHAERLKKYHKYMFGPFVEYVHSGKMGGLGIIDRITSLGMSLVSLIVEYSDFFDQGNYVEYRLIGNHPNSVRGRIASLFPDIHERLTDGDVLYDMFLANGIAYCSTKSSICGVMLNAYRMDNSWPSQSAIQLPLCTHIDVKEDTAIGFITTQAIGVDWAELMSDEVTKKIRNAPYKKLG